MTFPPIFCSKYWHSNRYRPFSTNKPCQPSPMTTVCPCIAASQHRWGGHRPRENFPGYRKSSVLHVYLQEQFPNKTWVNNIHRFCCTPASGLLCSFSCFSCPAEHSQENLRGLCKAHRHACILGRSGQCLSPQTAHNTQEAKAERLQDQH